MKILQVIPYFFIDWAGGKNGQPVETVYELSKALVERGHAVTVYTTEAFNKKQQSEYQSEPFFIEEGIEVREFRSLGKRLGNIDIIVSLAMIPAIAKEIRQFDVVHLHEYRTFQNVIAHHYAQKYGIPYVVQAHGSVATFFNKGMLKRIFDRLLGYRILKDSSKLIASTTMEAEQYKAIGMKAANIQVIPNGVNLSRFDNLPPKGEFRRKHALTENSRIILFLGRIHKVKGLDLLIKAFARLTNELSNTVLVIAGFDYGELSPLNKLANALGINEKTIFTGALSERNKLEAYVDADVYVLPSVYETFPITVLEACACGTPVILTDSCGIADIINNKAGIVVPRDEERLKSAILELLNDGEKRREFSVNGRLLVRNQFNWSKVATQIEGIYHRVLATDHQ